MPVSIPSSSNTSDPYINLILNSPILDPSLLSQLYVPAFSPMAPRYSPVPITQPSYSPTTGSCSPVHTLSAHMDNLARGGPLRFGATAPFLGSPEPVYVSYPRIYGLRWGSPAPEQAIPSPLPACAEAKSPSSPVCQRKTRSWKTLRSAQQPKLAQAGKRVRYPSSDSGSGSDLSPQPPISGKRFVTYRKPKGIKRRRPTVNTEDLLCSEDFVNFSLPPRAAT